MSAPPLIDYILLAEFDVDAGSTLRHSYPCAIRGLPPSLEGRLSELMLPDGAHLRATDETSFLLHGALPPPPPPDGTSTAAPVPVAADERSLGRPFLFASSACRTVLDSSRRRRADLKAVAFCSRNPLADWLRPALSAALDAVFAPGGACEATLAQLHGALSALPLPLDALPRRREREVLRGLLPLDGPSAGALYAPTLPQLVARGNRRRARAERAAAVAGGGSGG